MKGRSHRSQLTLILGPVGGGKSALLRAMLGEMDLLTGSVEKKVRSPAYCHQSPWLLNSSIRENIVGPDQDLDTELYRKALWACELDHDLREIIEGDQTKVGSSAVTLSGEQKQRIVNNCPCHGSVCSDNISNRRWPERYMREKSFFFSTIVSVRLIPARRGRLRGAFSDPKA